MTLPQSFVFFENRKTALNKTKEMLSTYLYGSKCQMVWLLQRLINPVLMMKANKHEIIKQFILTPPSDSLIPPFSSLSCHLSPWPSLNSLPPSPNFLVYSFGPFLHSSSHENLDTFCLFCPNETEKSLHPGSPVP